VTWQVCKFRKDDVLNLTHTLSIYILDLWGSRCTFSCRNNGILTHREPVVCNDNLQWQGTEPDCIIQQSNFFK
jgi:hypothetical protein